MFAQGAITTYAGGGGPFTGDGKPAAGAQIARPSDVTVDAKGNVYFTSPPHCLKPLHYLFGRLFHVRVSSATRAA